MIPIGDDNPREKTPYVTYALVGINVAAFLLFCLPTPSKLILAGYALIPEDPSLLTLFTSMFMHGGIMHLVGNMLFLWIFGDNVEDKLGHVAYSLFYLAAGLAASGLHIVTTSAAESHIPTLGASGAIAGVLGAYVVFFPRQPIKMLILFGFFTQIVRVPAFMWAGFWFLMQFIEATAGVPGVAHFAHIGGFVAGLAVAPVVKYLLFPARFGVQGLSVHFPSSLLASSRTPRSQAAISPSWATVDSEGIEFVDAAGHGSYAVLRTSDDDTRHRSIVHVLGEHLVDDLPAAKDRLRDSRGAIARGITRTVAERIQRMLRDRGVDAIVIPDDRTTQPTAPVEAGAVAWDSGGFAFTVGGDSKRIAWEVPYLCLGATAGGRPFIDIFVTPALRLRITPDARLVRIEPATGAERFSSLADLAADLISLRGRTLLNEGVRVLAGHGRWGWLAFRSPEAYEDYAFWAHNMVLARKPILRY